MVIGGVKGAYLGWYRFRSQTASTPPAFLGQVLTAPENPRLSNRSGPSVRDSSGAQNVDRLRSAFVCLEVHALAWGHWTSSVECGSPRHELGVIWAEFGRLVANIGRRRPICACLWLTLAERRPYAGNFHQRLLMLATFAWVFNRCLPKFGQHWPDLGGSVGMTCGELRSHSGDFGQVTLCARSVRIYGAEVVLSQQPFPRASAVSADERMPFRSTTALVASACFHARPRGRVSAPPGSSTSRSPSPR